MKEIEIHVMTTVQIESYLMLQIMKNMSNYHFLSL